MARGTAVALCVALSLTACDASSDGGRPRRSGNGEGVASPARKASETARRRPRDLALPARSKVVFHRVHGAGVELRQAIADLKRIGAWTDLTTHLYQIDITVRPGRARVPKDHHLADARFWRAAVARGTFDYPRGVFCWLRFFPAAMKDDLSRWRSYYDQGVTGRPPPTPRQFWASIVGHELYHCPARGRATRPEEGALAWERRIVAALRAAGG